MQTEHLIKSMRLGFACCGVFFIFINMYDLIVLRVKLLIILDAS
jgi:hypothetical protein